jgi:hypothetical protein
MSIRQRRLNTAEKIKEEVKNLQGKKITLVLANNTSVFGELAKAESDGLVMINGRLKKNHFPFPTIKELYFDEIV